MCVYVILLWAIMIREKYLHIITSKKIHTEALIIAMSRALGAKGITFDTLRDTTTWETARFLSQEADILSNLLSEKGIQLAQKEFKNFRPGRTILTSDIIEDLWVTTSTWCAERISNAWGETSPKVPGLVECVNQGYTKWAEKNFPFPSPTEIELTTTALDILRDHAKNLTKMDLFAAYRNVQFELFQREYGLYPEQTRELQTGRK
jgi:hypothetical protein